MELKGIKIKKGPNSNQMFEAIKNISKYQTQLFTIEVNDVETLLPCYIFGVTSRDEKDDVWNLVLIIRRPSFERHGWFARESITTTEVKVDANYCTNTMTGEIKIPVD